MDSVEQPLGLRFYSIDPDKGFFLNGEPYHLHGVNRHQDRPDKGWALTEADQDEDLRLIQEIGATVVRCAHYQHSDYFYSLCDKAGILVWAEISQVDKIGGDETFAETSRSQLLDLIRQNINHPAIFTWSLFNELRPGNPDPHRELQDLNLVAHGEDPTRPTIAATCVETLPQMNKIPDLLGYNIYPGWYDGWGTKDDFGPLLDRSRTMSQHGGLCVSEYGAGANVLQHEENMQRPPKTTGQWHPEEWQCILHESAWGAMKARPFVWGTFLWNMFDFTSYWRHEGGIEGRNDKGFGDLRPFGEEGRILFLQSELVGGTDALHHEPAIHRADKCGNEREDLFQREERRTSPQWHIAGRSCQRHQRRVRLESRPIEARRESHRRAGGSARTEIDG